MHQKYHTVFCTYLELFKHMYANQLNNVYETKLEIELEIGFLSYDKTPKISHYIFCTYLELFKHIFKQAE